MLPNFYVYTVAQLAENLLVATSYGPLLLDETDFDHFGFDPQWLIENIDSKPAHDLLCRIKMYYIDQAAKLRKEGVLL